MSYSFASVEDNLCNEKLCSISQQKLIGFNIEPVLHSVNRFLLGYKVRPTQETTPNKSFFNFFSCFMDQS